MTYAELESIRHSLGFTVAAFAPLIGVSIPTYYYYKNQRRMQPSAIILAKLLRDHPDTILPMIRAVM
jgi:transcriptional regulator with XRE-family HTH domain